MFFSRPELLKCKRLSIESRPILGHPSSLVHLGPIALVSVQCVFVLSVLVFTYCFHQAFDYLVKYNCLLHSLCFIYLLMFKHQLAVHFFTSFAISETSNQIH
jgi:hypothetical protein